MRLNRRKHRQWLAAAIVGSCYGLISAMAENIGMAAKIGVAAAIIKRKRVKSNDASGVKISRENKA